MSDAERPAGGYGREGRDEKDREETEEPEPAEGGRTWRKQPGYGERVLDPDAGEEAALEEAEQAETVEQKGD